MEYVLGIILLLSFVAVAIYCVKGGNLMISMLVMAALWTIICLVGKYTVTNPEFIAENADVMGLSVADILAKVFQAGPEGWGTVLVNVCFGAFFGRILLDTGIVSALIRKTVELGGDRPVITSTLLCLVSALCFTTMTGPGAVISIGIIVLPIMLSLGIQKNVAVWSYVSSVAAGFLLNPVIFTQYVAYFQTAQGGTEYTYADNLAWAAVSCVVMMLFILVISGVLIHRKQAVAWAVVKKEDASAQKVPGIALLIPVLPVVLVIFAKLPIILALLISALLALLLCGRMRSFADATKNIVKSFHDGVVDSAPIMGFFLTVPMFCAAANLCAPYFRMLIAPIVPDNPLIICIALAVLAPLGLYRGPLTIMGAGVVTVAILNGIGMPVTLMFPLLTATTIVMNCSACLTQSWNSWAVGYTKCSTNDFLKLSIPAGWVMTAALMVVTYIMRVAM